MKVGSITQQPAERFSYSINYSRALTTGDGLASVTSSVAPSGLTVNNVGVFDDNRVRFWVSGGTSGRTYKATFTVTTDDGRIFQDEVDITVKEV
jgi:hypothetical protein